MAFCRKCGHKNDADARFCEACGEPQYTEPAATAATAPQPNAQGTLHATSSSASRPSKRLLMMLTAGLVGLVILGAGLAFLLAPERASNESFGKAIDRLLLADPNLLREQYCLQNMNYREDTVLISTADRRTQSWMALLTEAGLYSGPETITTQHGFFTQTRLRFSKTEAGRKATHNNALCIADGLEVAEVLHFTPPQQVGQTEVSLVTVRLALRNPMPWTKTAQARQLERTLENAHSESARNEFILMRQDGKWVQANQSTLAQARTQAREQEQKSERTQEGAGFFANLAALFGFGPSNPILGVWSFEMIPGVSSRFEFDRHTMTTPTGQASVRYEIKDNRVLVYSTEHNQVLLSVRVIDSNNLRAELGGLDIRLTRVR